MGKRKKKQKERRPVKPSRRAPDPRLWTAGFYLLCLLLCLAVYGGITDNYLYNDDFEWLSKARYEMTADNLLTYRVVGGFLRPLVNMTFYVGERIAPGNIALYYYSNIFLHFLNTVLVFHLLSLLFRHRGVAAVAALYFLLMSAHAAAVMWISARTTLISTSFLLASVIVLIHPPRHSRKLVMSLIFFVLALASKETAVIGLGMVGLVFIFLRGRESGSLSQKAVLSFAIITVMYLIIRKVAVGGFVQQNWGPGFHMLRNLGGGFLFQLYPWGGAAFFGLGKNYNASTHMFWPEILAIPIGALFIVAAMRGQRLKEMGLALGWVIVCMIPVAAWKFRFFSTAMITHDRYYYLSSVGACAAVAVVLWMLWDSHTWRKGLRAAVVIVLVIVFAGEGYNLKLRQGGWRATTEKRRSIVSLTERYMDRFNSFETCAVEAPPMRFIYFKHALKLERPQWRVEQVADARAAGAHKPCLYLRFLGPDRVVHTELR